MDNKDLNIYNNQLDIKSDHYIDDLSARTNISELISSIISIDQRNFMDTDIPKKNKNTKKLKTKKSKKNN